LSELKYYLGFIILGIFFIFNFVASGIVGSYIIDAPNYQSHLIFTDAPFSKENISDIDKFIYAAKISAYPYFACVSLILIFVLIILKIKKSRKINYTN
jgi:hypothetical protein